ncbi:hypothetical protein AVEN_65803-1 [Araneus ventricosus]|uniref:Uncharacterized protein n=1 Tax=Araneus ventricosus TaxID=182803 RepID=A0A4Y2U467_ARAVE|nr:hypothetical protein AVEN_65803-1 [Araneus ventricosus]
MSTLKLRSVFGESLLCQAQVGREDLSWARSGFGRISTLPRARSGLDESHSLGQVGFQTNLLDPGQVLTNFYSCLRSGLADFSLMQVGFDQSSTLGPRSGLAEFSLVRPRVRFGQIYSWAGWVWQISDEL